MSLLLTSSPKGHLLGVDAPLSLSAGRHKANPAATYLQERVVECLPLPCPVCVTGSHVSPSLEPGLSCFFPVLSDNHFAKSVIKTHRTCVVLIFSLAWSPPPLEGGELGNLNDYPTSLLFFWEVGSPAGGARCSGLAPSGKRRPVLAGPSCLPRPPLGSVPVKLWSITRSLSRLLHIFALSVPPPPAS